MRKLYLMKQNLLSLSQSKLEEAQQGIETEDGKHNDLLREGLKDIGQIDQIVNKTLTQKIELSTELKARKKKVTEGKESLLKLKIEQGKQLNALSKDEAHLQELKLEYQKRK